MHNFCMKKSLSAYGTSAEFVRSSRATRKIGSGRPSRTTYQHHAKWPSMGLLHAKEDIASPTDWEIHNEECHTVIVHLGGYMQELATELEGRFGSVGPATPGEIWSIPAGLRYCSYAQGNDIEFAAVHLPVKLNHLAEIQPLAGVRDDFLRARVGKLTRLAVFTDDASLIEAETISHSVREHIYGKYSSAEQKDNSERPRLNTNQARLLREFVWDSLSEKILLSELARTVNMTTHHLLIAFRRLFGTTPAQYLITQRLRRARWLLLHSKLDITSVALESGFSSHSHLTTTFRRRFKQTPTEFRRQHH